MEHTRNRLGDGRQTLDPRLVGVGRGVGEVENSRGVWRPDGAAEIAGEIVSIAPKSSASNSAIVAYEVRLSLGETSLPVLIGMTAEADLITAAKEGVLLVPNQAITPDRSAGTYSVNLVETSPEGGITTRPVEVTIGLKDSDYTEITSGLQEGDRLSINIITTADATDEPRGLFGGGMRPPADAQ